VVSSCRRRPISRPGSRRWDRFITNHPSWDREVDIAWLPSDHRGGDIYGKERDWGLGIRNRQDDSTRRRCAIRPPSSSRCVHVVEMRLRRYRISDQRGGPGRIAATRT
jgi:hypothetical protein